ncbi:AraC family transcriptional regulator [Eubacterium uniforme]|uniref:AraC-like ligand binding domain-containing protein n=1 Tax=Eubacterium uniforme TaxID=39495 RepID=A0A1T4W4E3_9FIRM|nr:AraC family transcriptional regulator [Eubacterium uniforme]SKA72103.1 AraC-like ligand binding domain-containing protein [Eubacterium uniforme]HAH19038.1 AraC family transcriptional regulator [Eubacterium sp.]HAV90775.1 AraC family transcriptional regulator [Eubacterium sp.]
MRIDLRENVPHGTKEYGYVQYHIKNNPRMYQIPVHWHEHFEIIYIVRSGVKVNIEDKTFVGNEGDIFLVNPGELHYIGTENYEAEFYTILFPLEFISFRTDDTLEENLTKPLRVGALKYEHQVKNKSLIREFRMIINSLILLDHNKAKNHFQSRIYLLQIFQLLYTYKHPLYKISKQNETLLQKDLIEYMRSKYAENISLTTMAEEFHMSEKYLSRYFKAHFNIGYSEFLLHLRLNKARELLETTELPITDVALSSGFGNISYFIRSFRKLFGMPPLQYRKSL